MSNNLLKTAAIHLQDRMIEYASETVEYRRGEESFSLQAIIGQIEYETSDNNGFIIRAAIRDFIINQADFKSVFGFDSKPERNDQILQQNGDAKEVYKVNADSIGSAHYRESDPYQVAFRVHTVLTETTEPAVNVSPMTEAVTSYIDQRLVAALDRDPDPANSMRIFSTANKETGEFVRSADLFMNPAYVDLSGIPATGGGNKSAPLLTPRMGFTAAHYGPSPGATFWFVSSLTNASYQRTVVKRYNHPSADIAVVVFDEDLPPDIKPLRMFPRDWPDYFLPLGQEFVTLQFDRLDRMGVCDVYYMDGPEGDTGRGDCWNIRNAYGLPSYPVREPFYIELTNGDSGHPGIWLPVNKFQTVPVLACTWTSGSGGSGASINSPVFYDWIIEQCQNEAGQTPIVHDMAAETYGKAYYLDPYTGDPFVPVEQSKGA